MSRSAVKVDVDWSRLQRELSGSVAEAQHALDVQVVKDTTPYVPRDTGNLKNTAIRASVPGSGEVVWEGPYAAKQYYELPNKAHDVHPLATMMWFESAKSACRDAWLRVAKRVGGTRR